MTEIFKYIYLNDRNRQIEILKESFRKDLKPFVEEAFNIVCGEDGKIKENKVDSSIEIIEKVANHLAQNPQNHDLTKLIPETVILSNELLKKINPYINNLRKELFSSETPPFFEDPDSAIKWIKAEANKEGDIFRTKWNDNEEIIEKIQKEIEEKNNKLFQLTGRHFSNKIENFRLLPIPLKIINKWTGDIEKISIFPRTKLADLEEETRILSKETGFTQLSLILYVFTGIKPISLKYNIQTNISFGKLNIKKRVNISFERPLKKEEINELFFKIKSAFGRKGEKDLSKKHMELYLLVGRLGGDPKSDKMKFWQKVLKEWNKKNPNDRFKTDRNIRYTYYKFMNRLKEKN
ncbi:MAG: hypothetical protein JXB26_01390 [Candidatus Aminicenantes bacterium]|nr:hypothetical protein [Candidatus Aminicenantes bacterium]